VAIVDPAYEAVSVTVADAGTVDVSTRKVTLRDPPDTVTVGGTLTMVESLLVSRTSAPPPGAADASVTVAWG
jgi:hypothetical protein